MKRLALRLSTALAGLSFLVLAPAASSPGGGGRAALAQPPSGAPVFSNPLAITNQLVPFVPGAVKVHAGTDHGVPYMCVVTHSRETRDFEWGGATVSCRIVEEVQFLRGAPAGTERAFVAQSDDGAVWTFGEIEDSDPNDDGGDDSKDPGGWIVGQRAATDPTTTVTDAAPALLMPAAPSVGDQWSSRSPPSFVSTDRVLATNVVLRVAGGRHAGCVRLRSTDVTEEAATTFWYAPGVGIVKTKGEGERTTLRASSFGRRR
jgi:hypothetical protein